MLQPMETEGMCSHILTLMLIVFVKFIEFFPSEYGGRDKKENGGNNHGTIKRIFKETL